MKFLMSMRMAHTHLQGKHSCTLYVPLFPPAYRAGPCTLPLADTGGAVSVLIRLTTCCVVAAAANLQYFHTDAAALLLSRGIPNGAAGGPRAGCQGQPGTLRLLLPVLPVVLPS